jgi:hypothetical protein
MASFLNILSKQPYMIAYGCGDTQEFIPLFTLIFALVTPSAACSCGADSMH